jgi:hypothetical protein
VNFKNRMIAGSALLALWQGACAGPSGTTRPADSSPGKAPFAIPPDCERSQTGRYHHGRDPRYRYEAVDDGVRLMLSVSSPTGLQAGTSAPTIELERTPHGFEGQTRATGFNGEQKPCPLTFPTAVTACDAKGITLETAHTALVDEHCRLLPDSNGQAVEHRLERDDAP